jgi:FkbM family methyltransferase
MAVPKAGSGAEGGVDDIVNRKFFSDPGPGKIFVEVGAARPDYLSTSALFRNLGWRIIAIEPNPDFCKLQQDKGHEVLQYACGAEDEDNVDFFVVNSHGVDYLGGKVSFESFSSLGVKAPYAELKNDLDQKKIKVNVRRLNTILQTHAPDVSEIDILSIDVEGWELEVIAGLDMHKFRPKVMIIENLFDSKEYRVTIKAHGYVLWKHVYPNDVYVRMDLIPGYLRWFYEIR